MGKKLLNFDGEERGVWEGETRMDINVGPAGLGGSDDSERRCRMCGQMTKCVKAVSAPPTALQEAVWWVTKAPPLKAGRQG